MPCLQKRLSNQNLLPPLWAVLLRHQIEQDFQYWPSCLHSGLACSDLVDEAISLEQLPKPWILALTGSVLLSGFPRVV